MAARGDSSHAGLFAQTLRYMPRKYAKLVRVCAVCRETKSRDDYRTHQWRNCGQSARCLDCLNTASAATFKKGEVVQCKSCDGWMRAPLDERVAGLKCANCRQIIAPPAKRVPAVKNITKKTHGFKVRQCAACQRTKRREEFRTHQWRNCGTLARCLECVATTSTVAAKVTRRG